MAERIYTRDQQGRLEPLEGERFAKEGDLHLGGHPKPASMTGLVILAGFDPSIEGVSSPADDNAGHRSRA